MLLFGKYQLHLIVNLYNSNDTICHILITFNHKFIK